MNLQKQRLRLQAKWKRGSSGGKPLLQTPVLRWAGAMGLGAIFAAAALTQGVLPLGVAYVAAAGQPVCAALGAFICYLLQGGNGLVYGASALVILTCRLVLKGTPISKNRWLWPICASGTLLCTKSVVAFTDGLRGIVLLLCEVALCCGFSVMLREAREPLSPLRLWGRLTAAMAALLAMQPVRLFGIFSPARCLAAFLTLAAGCFGGGACGAAVGVAFGACLDLAAGQGPFFAVTLCFSGLLCGLSGKRDKLPAALCFCVADGLAALWFFSHPNAVAGLYECFCGAAGFVLLPRGLSLRLEQAFSGVQSTLPPAKTPQTHTGVQLQGLSLAVGELGQTLETLWRGKISDRGDLGSVYRCACEQACRGCKKREQCWQRDYGDTKRALNAVVQPLRAKNALIAGDFPDYFAQQCVRLPVLCGAVNDAYRELLRQQARQGHERELRGLMRRQYESLQAVLESMAGSAGEGTEYDPALDGQVRRIVRAYLPKARTSVCLTGGKLQVDILLPEQEDVQDTDALLRTLTAALGVALRQPVKIESRKGMLLRVCQREAYGLRVAAAVRKKQGEQVCGDNHQCIHTSDGRSLALLSDGMGTGEAAGVLSGRALELIASFVRSGCSLAESTAAVLPVLAARFEEWGFVTLDLLEVCLYTGRASLLKYGAAPTFLLRDGRRTKLCADALPAGLEPVGDQPVPAAKLRLQTGDRIVLMSDGVWENTQTEELLRTQEGESGQALANRLIEAAVSAGVTDDMTVLVADFVRCEEAEG